MSDYISREKVLDALLHEQYGYLCEDAINRIPAADVRPVVRGKWKVSAHKTYYDVSCSVCGINSFFQVDEKDSVSYANFCPNCGADMGDRENEKA